MAEMPKFKDLFTDVLLAASDGKVWKRQALRDEVIHRLALPSDLLEERMGGGGLRINSRVHWAVQYLVTVKAMERPSRGALQITQRGKDLLQDHPSGVALDHIRQFPEYAEWDARSQGTSNKKSGDSSVSHQFGTGDEVPIEQIESAVSVLRSTVRAELLERLRSESPEFLERAVLKVLHSMGYGSSTDDLEHLGGPGDGGVDGLIRQDKLGLDQIYVQAKRYQQSSSIGRPDIQQFVGALSGRSATRGVFITTRSFSKEARDFVTSLPGQKVILLDGDQVTELMIEFGVGVSVTQVIKTYEVDSNFFESD